MPYPQPRRTVIRHIEDSRCSTPYHYFNQAKFSLSDLVAVFRINVSSVATSLFFSKFGTFAWINSFLDMNLCWALGMCQVARSNGEKLEDRVAIVMRLDPVKNMLAYV